jgi:hypothetical protein
VVPRAAQLGERKLVILDLGFLRADEIGPCIGQPVEQVREADLERVDIPRCDAQAALRT